MSRRPIPLTVQLEKLSFVPNFSYVRRFRSSTSEFDIKQYIKDIKRFMEANTKSLSLHFHWGSARHIDCSLFFSTLSASF